MAISTPIRIQLNKFINENFKTDTEHQQLKEHIAKYRSVEGGVAEYTNELSEADQQAFLDELKTMKGV